MCSQVGGQAEDAVHQRGDPRAAALPQDPHGELPADGNTRRRVQGPHHPQGRNCDPGDSVSLRGGVAEGFE